MAKRPDKNLIVGLDVGTSKVVAIVGEITPEGLVEVLGLGSYPSTGLKRGVVVNIEATVASIQRAIEEAELMAGCQISAVYTCVSGSHITSFNSHGIVAIREHEVTQTDVDRVIDAAKAVAIPADQKIIHILPQQFIIDAQTGIREPVGMSGVRLEATVHMVTGSVSAAQNIVKCVRRCGLDVEDMIAQQIASSYAVLTRDEKELGVCVVDIGGGTTDIAVFHGGSIIHTAVLPVAGDQITNDIAVALRASTQTAESIKMRYGSAMASMVNVEEMMDVPSSASERPVRKVPQITLAEVIEPRVEELFLLLLAELQRAGVMNLLGSGLVITGGSARMRGMVELAEDVFQLPVRLGMPHSVSGLAEVIHNPSYSTGIGLLLYGVQQQAERSTALPLGQSFPNIFGRMKRWFEGRF